jgi:hypothetical protein
LHIKGKNPARGGDPLGQEGCVMPITGGGIDHPVAGLKPVSEELVGKIHRSGKGRIAKHKPQALELSGGRNMTFKSCDDNRALLKLELRVSENKEREVVIHKLLFNNSKIS